MNDDDIRKLAREIEDLKELSALYAPGFADLSDGQINHIIEQMTARSQDALDAVEAARAELQLRELKSILR